MRPLLALFLLLVGLALHATAAFGTPAAGGAEAATAQYHAVTLPTSAAALPTEARYTPPAERPNLAGSSRAGIAASRPGTPPAPRAAAEACRAGDRRTDAVPRYRAHRALLC